MNNNLNRNPFLAAPPIINLPSQRAPFSVEGSAESAPQVKTQQQIEQNNIDTNNTWAKMLEPQFKIVNEGVLTKEEAKNSEFFLGVYGQTKLDNFRVKFAEEEYIREKVKVTETTPTDQERVQVIEVEKESSSWVSKITEETMPIVEKYTPKLFRGLFGLLGVVFELFLGKTAGFEFAYSEKPKTKKEDPKTQAEQAKDKRKEKQIKFVPGSLQFNIPRPKAVAQEEIAYTDKMNDFHESYIGVVNQEGQINAYHRANREKKELESKAAQIANERASKIQSGRGKITGFNTRVGELLMGAENPSHFTKALG